MKRFLATLVLGASLLYGAAAAHAKSIRYHGQHPLPSKLGGGFCYIEVPHVHAFGPAETRLYRVHDDEYYFVGDPVPWGYEGPRYAFYGPHPVVEADVQFGEPVYCYLDGPHYHEYQPVASASFELRGGAYWYVGSYDPVYYRMRPRYGVVNEVYRPIAYERPVVDVTVAPPGFHGVIVAGGPGFRGRAVVAGPAVSAGVRVYAPPPPQVHFGVSVGGPPAPVVVEHERVIVEERREGRWKEHHDNGRHEGWHKQGRHGD